MLIYLRLVLDQLVRTLAIGRPPHTRAWLQPKLEITSGSVTTKLTGSLDGHVPRFTLVTSPIVVDAVGVPALAIRLCPLHRL